ncbi:MAG: hypothetical protein GXP30_01750, partial [Verrucomicrobia bacterium]|nr:hypothetical protein [Verrucomicrobiota bacterium]
SRTPEGVRVVQQRAYLLFTGAPVKGSKVQGNLFVSKEAGQTILYEHQKPWRRGGSLRAPSALSSCKANRNLYFNTEDKLWADEFLQEQRKRGVEKESIVLDPKFVDPEKDDFRIKAEFVIQKLGVEQIDVREAGVRKGIQKSGGTTRQERTTN